MKSKKICLDPEISFKLYIFLKIYKKIILCYILQNIPRSYNSKNSWIKQLITQQHTNKFILYLKYFCLFTHFIKVQEETMSCEKKSPL